MSTKSGEDHSTDIATVFLDNDLNIKRFTEQAKELVMFRSTDVGRPISELASNLEHDDLAGDCRAVLRTLVFKEREVLTKDGSWYLMRIMPYRTANNVIDGLVLTFVDVNRLKRAEQELAIAKERLASDLEAMIRLLQVGVRLKREGGTAQEILAEILDAALLIAGTDRGSIQFLDSVSGKLTIRVQRGFDQEWLDYWREVDESQGAGGTALRKGERVIIEDVRTSPVFAGTPALEVQLKAGVQAVQSVPLMNRAGKIFGVLSTHFPRPHRPDDRMLSLLDLLAQQASAILERVQLDEAPKDEADQ